MPALARTQPRWASSGDPRLLIGTVAAAEAVPTRGVGVDRKTAIDLLVEDDVEHFQYPGARWAATSLLLSRAAFGATARGIAEFATETGGCASYSLLPK